jgi:ankyrin repeat protein
MCEKDPSLLYLQDNYNRLPLHYAVAKSKLDIVNFIFQKTGIGKNQSFS